MKELISIVAAWLLGLVALYGAASFIEVSWNFADWMIGLRVVLVVLMFAWTWVVAASVLHAE